MIQVSATGLAEMTAYFEAAPRRAAVVASRAINQTAARKALPIAREAILKEAAFPAGYLDLPDRLDQTAFATPDQLIATITGRFRATSLARFADPSVTPDESRSKSYPGIRIEVRPGQSIVSKRIFVVRLRQGSAAVTTDQYNRGLAIRLKPGETLQNKKVQAVQLADNVYILYGPSVSQIFADVAETIAPDVGSELASEFMRQFALDID